MRCTHVRGDLGRYLDHLDAALARILDSYRTRTGRELELAVVSDHGNNGRWNASMVDLPEFLRRQGYHAARGLAGPRDVVFSTDGVTTGVGVFAHDAQVPSLATSLASPEAWLSVSADHEYPAALARILRGHRDVTENPAPILLSMEDGYQVANGMASFFSQLRPLGGTHGGLNALNSLGIVMSTYRPTIDALSTDVARQFDGFQRMVATTSH